MPERRHSSFGTLHPRRICRVIVVEALLTSAFLLLGRLTQTLLQFPDSFSAYNRLHRTAFEFPALKRRVARG